MSIPEDFENGLVDETESFLGRVWRTLREEFGDKDAIDEIQEEARPQTVGVYRTPEPEPSDMVEMVGGQMADNGLFGCLVVGAALLGAFEWFTRNLGGRR